MPSPSLPVIVPAGSTIVCVGDSFIGPGATAPHNELTAGFGAAIGWEINRRAALAFGATLPRLKGTGARRVIVPNQIIVIDNGVSGSGVQSNGGHTGLSDAARYATVIADLPATGPCFLYWGVSQNDRGTWNNFSAWQTSAEIFANAVAAARPNCTFMLSAMFFGDGEVVSRTGPAAWSLNDFDGQTDALNAQVKTWAAGRGYYWLDVRGTNITDPDTIALWEWTNNPGQVAFGPAFLTQDGGHPNFVTGQGVIANMIVDRLALPY